MQVIERCTREARRVPMDVNIYATRKTVAQGMMDIALLTANASQLKYVLSHSDMHEYFLINITLIGTSMALQIIVGIMLILVGRSNINYKKHQKGADEMNNAIVVMIFLITVVNVLISAFSVDVVEYDDTFTTVPPLDDDGISDKVQQPGRVERDLQYYWPNCSERF
ncbi:ninjurin-2-like isoform X2 [Centruroides sculpturatus]|uniref:ninjurin-2-like isoform X2 n=1 Tax=Centruroides sculpturatus TaxID=218467 RepID=UPI000C6DC3C5|nr:ninjurin-2-like isoform X2 [Centruroides sculpturatus]